jgi:hypothetical protein
MKTMLFATVAAVAAVAMTTAAYAVVLPQIKETRCLIQGEGLNIRENPDLDAPLVAILEPSDMVSLGRIVTGPEGRKWAWVEVRGDEGSYKGWVSFKYLTCQGSRPHEAPRLHRVYHHYMPILWWRLVAVPAS